MTYKMEKKNAEMSALVVICFNSSTLRATLRVPLGDIIIPLLENMVLFFIRGHCKDFTHWLI